MLAMITEDQLLRGFVGAILLDAVLVVDDPGLLVGRSQIRQAEDHKLGTTYNTRCLSA